MLLPFFGGVMTGFAVILAAASFVLLHVTWNIVEVPETTTRILLIKFDPSCLKDFPGLTPEGRRQQLLNCK